MGDERVRRAAEVRNIADQVVIESEEYLRPAETLVAGDAQGVSYNTQDGAKSKKVTLSKFPHLSVAGSPTKKLASSTPRR